MDANNRANRILRQYERLQQGIIIRTQKKTKKAFLDNLNKQMAEIKEKNKELERIGKQLESMGMMAKLTMKIKLKKELMKRKLQKFLKN